VDGFGSGFLSLSLSGGIFKIKKDKMKLFGQAWPRKKQVTFEMKIFL